MLPLRLFDPSDESSGITVAEVVARYLQHTDDRALAGLLKQETAQRAHFYCDTFAADFGARHVAECRQNDLIAFIAGHLEYRSPHTKHDAVGAVVTAFRWAHNEGIIERCPYARSKELPACEPRAPIRPEEIRAILNHARRHGRRMTRLRFRQALWFLWETGCRTCELREIGWEHYDDERGLFELPGKTTGRTGKKRLLVLPSRAWRLVRWLRRRDSRSKGPVFRNGRDGAWTRKSFGKLFRNHADAAGVRPEVSAYSARHGFTCEALEGGAGERQLADYLGHANTRYVGYYGRGVRERIDYLRAAADLRR